jgi:hypothetical protein
VHEQACIYYRQLLHAFHENGGREHSD